jgi:glycosyltransferase involved in cell wall biosynthesis
MNLFSRRIRLGILANEFLDPSIGRMGGFGWAARSAANVFKDRPELGVDPVFLTGSHRGNRERRTVLTEGVRLVLKRRRWHENAITLARERLDLVLAIEYRPNYDPVFRAIPTVPIVTWVRDPHSPADEAKIFSLRIPGRESVQPAGIWRIHSRGLAKIAGWSKLFRRPVLLANKMAHLRAKNEATYGLPASDIVLPNPDIIDYRAEPGAKSEYPLVVFLGRLDPIKRPWLFLNLARRFPEVDFLMLGANQQRRKPGAWQPEDIPSNVQMPGHVGGAEKLRALESAWVLVNTSIHEESPVSVFEALACRTPVLTYEDWGGIADRFGASIGQHPGTGMTGLDPLARELRRLLEDHAWRQAPGRSGREWVTREHSTERFIRCFAEVCRATGRRVFRGDPAGPGPEPGSPNARSKVTTGAEDL